MSVFVKINKCFDGEGFPIKLCMLSCTYISNIFFKIFEKVRIITFCRPSYKQNGLWTLFPAEINLLIFFMLFYWNTDTTLTLETYVWLLRFGQPYHYIHRYKYTGCGENFAFYDFFLFEGLVGEFPKRCNYSITVNYLWSI